MQCPHCNYVEYNLGAYTKDSTHESGREIHYSQEGNFFIGSVQDLSRLEKYLEHARLIGCPKCLKVFIEPIIK